jgi:hypothetical protein
MTPGSIDFATYTRIAYLQKAVGSSYSFSTIKLRTKTSPRCGEQIGCLGDYVWATSYDGAPEVRYSAHSAAERDDRE